MPPRLGQKPERIEILNAPAASFATPLTGPFVRCSELFLHKTDGVYWVMPPKGPPQFRWLGAYLGAGTPMSALLRRVR